MPQYKLRFKGYEFSCNPTLLSIKGSRRVIEFLSPLCGSIVQDLGENARVITGEGVFVGRDCLDQYNNLYQHMKLSASGLLHIPEHKPIHAIFESLTVTARPTPNALYYSFRFTESMRGSHTVGDNI